MLFKNVTYIDEAFNVCIASVLTEGERITYIGEKPPAVSNKDTVNCAGKLLMPAFVNAHAHAPMTLLRGYGENMVLSDWLNKLVFPFEDKLRGQDVYYATLLAVAEGLRYGIASSSEMYFFCAEMAEAIIESGAKVNLSRGTSCFDTDLSYFKSQAYRETEELVRHYAGKANGRIVIENCIHAEYTSHESFVKEVAEYSSEKGLAIQVHVSETLSEHEECIARHKRTPARYFYDCGLFNTRTTLAHGVYLTEEDFGLLSEKGVSIASCPVSNLKLASGVFDYTAAKRHGINVALGTDSVCSNNNLNMFEETKLFSILHKGISHCPTLVSPSEALYAATKAGAIAQNREDCGAIKVGNRADLVLVDVSSPSFFPVHNALNNLVYSSCGGEVTLTMCDGKVLYRDGQYLTIDIEKVKAEVEGSRKRILSEL